MNTVFALITTMLLTLVAVQADAKCYSGNNWKKSSKFYVCVKGSESSKNRNRAEAICAKVRGSKCDAVTTYSSSCNGHCYDAQGKKHHSLSGY